MSQRLPDNPLPGSPLHLRDLVVTGFRGIDALTIGRLGRVTLLAGRNGVGKTTVLDAVRVFAARGRYSLLRELLVDREELVAAEEGDEKKLMPDVTALFHGREARGGRIVVGPANADEQVTIEEVELTPDMGPLVERLISEEAADGPVRGLQAVFRGAKQDLAVSFVREPGARGIYSRRSYKTRPVLRRAFADSNRPAEITCHSLGPGVLDSHEIARHWDAIALTDHETEAEEALRLVVGDQVRRVAVIGNDNRHGIRRRTIVKLQGHPHPVPLKSLGDGAVRLFGVALALANSRDGFLVIDEAENGIHHSLQRAFWRMVLTTAQANNVQVLATTHSADCVRGFAEAADESEEIQGALVRIVRRDGETWAVEYSEKNMRIAAEQGIEVR